MNQNNSKISSGNLRRFTQMATNTTAERCYFLLIHLFFSTIIFIIVYVRLEQFNNKQEKLFALLKSNQNLTFHHELQSLSLNHNNYNIDCSCQSFPYPKRNRTTRCLDLQVGLTDMITDVFCPISHYDQEDNQWLIIQNRQTNNIDFNRTWSEYRRGFGNIHNQTDFWIGNENLYWLTYHYQCRLKIELTDWHNETRIAIYESFRISDRSDDYRIKLHNYTGDMERFTKIDSFSRWHHNTPFSTYDHHYSADKINCPNLHGSGWWYHSGPDCAHVQLNGLLATHSDGLVPYNTGILWTGWKIDRHYSFQRVQMSIQQKLKRDRRHHR